MFKLYFFLLVAFFNSFSNGYDASLMGGINNMDYYRTYFSISSKTGSETGLIFSVFAIGNICGSFFCGPLSDLWGRRWGMFHGAVIIIAGACIQGFAYSGPNRDNRVMFILGRFLVGFGTATSQTAGPSYVAEMAHPAWRGVLTGFFNCWFFLGGITATWTMYRTSMIKSEISWRLPSWLQCVPAGLVMIGCIFIPETPRWLFSNDQQEEAIRVLTKFHGGGNRRSPIVVLTLREMIDRILIEGSDKRWWDYSELVISRAARYRLLCVGCLAVFGQWSGNGAVTYFMPVLLEHVGIHNPTTQLLYNAVLHILQFTVSTCGALCIDRLGRRPTLMVGTSLFVVWWLIITVLMSFIPLDHRNGLDQMDHKATSIIQGSRAAIAMIYLFALTYSFSYTPLQALYPVECLSYETRAKGMGIYNLIVNIAALYNTYGIPTVVEKIGWKMYWIYVVWNVFEVIFIWFFFVETKGRTLEEINEIFEAKNPVKKSLQKHIVEETDLGLLYHGLLSELQDMEGVVSPLPQNPHVVPPGFSASPYPLEATFEST
ncbi:general substrate transporter [Kalaharituber pfeilii]|nr:general substrate transporter [Kalaharituber pfeilii]